MADDDQIVPVAASAEKAAKIVKSAQLKVYSGASHGLAQTDRFARAATSHAVAPPIRLMNSRRFMPAPRLKEGIVTVRTNALEGPLAAITASLGMWVLAV